jgi:hypothetical protein
VIKLYYGSGATDLQVGDETLPAEYWKKLRGTAVKLLRTRGNRRAADLLEEIPWDLRDGTNGFGDEFSVLYWSAPLDRYVEAAEWAENRTDAGAFAQMAKVVGEVASTTYVRFVAVDISTDEGPAAVDNPNLAISTDVVERALNDAEQLMSTTGATSGVDRVHTALHGYLKAVCDEKHIAYPSDANITRLFRIVREQHPAFAAVGPRAEDVQRVVNGFASTIDALNTIRNQASAAHPNATLLDEPEAMLMINAVRTILHYLDAKIG